MKKKKKENISDKKEKNEEEKKGIFGDIEEKNFNEINKKKKE